MIGWPHSILSFQNNVEEEIVPCFKMLPRWLLRTTKIMRILCFMPVFEPWTFLADVKIAKISASFSSFRNMKFSFGHGDLLCLENSGLCQSLQADTGILHYTDYLCILADTPVHIFTYSFYCNCIWVSEMKKPKISLHSGGLAKSYSQQNKGL